MAAINQDEVRALDRVRQRLVTFANTLGALRQDLINSDQIPPWPILSDQIQTVTRTLANLQDTIAENSAFLNQAHAYPLPSFPGRTQQGLLGQLLRKKLDPSVEDAIENARKEARHFIPEVNGADGAEAMSTEGGKLGEQDLAELWVWAGPGESEIAHSIFTAPESMDEDEEGSEDEEEDEDGKPESAAAAPAVKAGEPPTAANQAPNMELFFRFMSTGRDPALIARDLQWERDVQRMAAGKGRSMDIMGGRP